MEDNIFDKVHEVDLKKTMEESYIDYAMSVIASRALPDVRDGLKPVQRRVLFSMIELNNGPDKPHRKCARIVGDTMGKYHPHGDSSIYGALVNMAQDWSTRYPLVDGHGNFGSVDGDGAAAMRYTEARLSKISMEMLADINKNTVDFAPNFDETEKEPTVLPARYPNLLVNGTSGIAVGMATNIPPHNLKEIIAAVVKIIDNIVEENRDTEIEEILKIVKGPDFPTGATILGTRGIEEAYRTGRGKIRVRAVSNIETLPNGKSQIIVTELPYLVNKARLIEKIADLVKEKKIDGITALNDHSSREGMRICIELRRDVNANVLLNKLYKHTQLQDTFGVIMLALVNNQPKVMNLMEILKHYLAHQEEVVTRRTQYDLNKARERAHILEGLLKALDNIDEVIRIIRGSENTQVAKARLMERFELSDAQAQAIVDMRLRTLTGLEREKLEAEYKELMARIRRLEAILADRNLLLRVIREEILAISEKYGDERKTAIGFDEFDISMEDMIPNENTVITMTKLGYIKRMTVDNFRSQNRGGKGIKGMQTIEDDYIDELLMTTTHHYLMFFTNMGKVYRLKAYEIPEAGRTARGTAIINLLQLQAGEKITAVLSLKDYSQGQYLFMATKSGIVKKTPIQDYANVRKTGLAAISLKDDDELIEVKFTDNKKDIILATKYGQCIRFKDTDVRSTGRVSMGVRGINLSDGDEIIGMQLCSQGDYLLIVSEKGMGKRTSMSEFSVQNRGGKGVKCYKITEKTGNVVGVKAVNDDNEVMMITTEGIIIRIACSDISILGRITSGVKLMNLDEKVSVASIAKVREKEENTEVNEQEDTESEE
ncbi:MAG: DNA gyrase subunit A [Oliverpabstia intestinalis]|jgi:DNA gyrase subunit A|uniref:DNA gyrase subunit A n=1 Tax=Oliverpabstia intestinalis TaxID=2606633 RepID=A0A7X2P4J6_9FIRM|nr:MULTISPECIES: DNA gyrase subunit A [Oliverpabstia]MCF2543136.1 DNA gyrase subunit A [Blautia producta]MCI7525583.1 DNA gyrase subunit A [Oliverpabstia sp.]MDY5790090.1 DNA gyrase subunit A [Oliverpabstia intestinalis]MST67331.1 DNA gyrase subunit A [Oliverpabstia intestinalis]